MRYVSDSKQVNEWLAQKASAVLLCDEHSLKYCRSLIQLPSSVSVIVVPAGESYKQLDQCSRIWDQLIESRANRHTELLILGGGVLCDMGGLCATLFMRGMPFSFIPTTLLAMADAAHGGKLAVDFGALKNYIGTFKHAQEVLIYPAWLQTLPKRHLHNGWIEMLKHALIADADHWRHLLTSKPADLIGNPELLKRSIEIKRAVVDEDPLESGKRKILNAGHTVGHAVESIALSEQHDVLHGEAIAAGLIVELLVSHQLKKISLQISREIIQQLMPYVPEKEWLLQLNSQAIWSYAQKDKKNKQGVNMSLIGPLGHCSWDDEVNYQTFNECWDDFMVKLKN